MAKTLQIVAIPLLLCFGILGCVSPRWISSLLSKPEKALQIGSAFSAGVFIGAGLLHLLTDAQEDADESDLNEKYPVSNLIVSIGFIVLLAIELFAAEITQRAQAASNHVHGDSFELMEGDNASPTLPKMSVEPQSDTHSNLHLIDSPWIAIGLTVALCAHSIIAGLALGTSETKAAAVFIAILAHKLVAAYALGSELLLTKINKGFQWGIIGLFSMSTPLGIIIGLAIASSVESNNTMAVIKSLAAGTFLYIGGAHLSKELHEGLHLVRSYWQMLAYLFGFTVMALLAIVV
eukprot:TRINITY_DN6331_c0_g1_i3.p1 TRINITY_DN6331_c0_g1~~TRINITY_DN6331_c0_g1_i3.p1  ORF type:complete len:292 (+),score=26.26 TRINITY_DN6331_c0_g1_i3:85-960(+)